MSDPEGFLTRWSRRKREVAEEEEEAAAASEDATPHVDAAPAAALPIPPPLAGEEGAFDPASLPPIDSITADTDLRAFFAPGVPGDLLHAALRRAWTSDPKIRDFVGLSENAWDFNAGAIPGFGPLDATEGVQHAMAQSLDEVQRTLEQPAAPSVEATQPPASTRLSDTASTAGKTDEQVAGQTGQDQASETTDKKDHGGVGESSTELPKVDIASQHKSDAPQYTALPIRRSHGRALPE